jgi:hypothetical protein
MRGGGAIGGGIFRSVAESSREGGGGRRSGELPPCCMLLRGARAGILDGLFMPDADMEPPNPEETELANGLRDTLAPKFETGVLARLGGGPRTVAARLGADLGPVAGFVGIPVFEGVFARGGTALEAEAYNSSRYRLPWTRNGRPYSSSQSSSVFFKSCDYISFALA